VVVIQYRLGVVGKSLALPHHIRTIELTIIGFLAGTAVKRDGALNAGLRKFL
jgi:hypothetical protein